ncbi:MAG: T9SS type A sorting domain-containing protein, partial [Bacteroidales bacterium]|nr:T9SS type A sorting domain-containing protein [Bacteroidales bacterium]
DRTFSNLSSNNITGLYEPNTKEYPYNLNVFPNPFKKNSIIQYKLDERSRVNIELYNALGENIATILPSQLQEIGAYKYNIETNNFSGFYYLKIKVNEKLIIRKLICN